MLDINQQHPNIPKSINYVLIVAMLDINTEQGTEYIIKEDVLIVAMLDINKFNFFFYGKAPVLIVAMLDINPKDCILLAPFNSSINCGYVRYKLMSS